MKPLIAALLLFAFTTQAQAETSELNAVKTAMYSEFASVPLRPLGLRVELAGDSAVAAQYFVYSEEPGWNTPWETVISAYSVKFDTLTFSVFDGGVVTVKRECKAMIGKSDGHVDFVKLVCPGLGVVSEVMIQRSQGTMPAVLL